MQKIIMLIMMVVMMSYANLPYNYVPYDELPMKSSEEQLLIHNATNVILNTNKKIEYQDAYNIAQYTYDMTKSTTLDYQYVMGIMMTESRFNYKAKSYCGAMGLMQIMPKTFLSVAKEHGLLYNVNDGYDVEKNIQIGILYLDKLNRKYEHTDYVSASYNGGPRAAKNYKMGRYDNVPKQTMAYVRKVNKYKEYFVLKNIM